MQKNTVTFQNERLKKEAPEAFKKIFDAAENLSVTSYYLLTSSDTAAKGGQAHPSSAALGEANAALDTTAVALDTAAVATGTFATAAVATDTSATMKSKQGSEFDAREGLRALADLRFELNARAEIFNHDNNPIHFRTFEDTTMEIFNGIAQFSQDVANEVRRTLSPGQIQQLEQGIEQGAAELGRILSECWHGVSDLVSESGTVALDGCADCCDATADCCCAAGQEMLWLPVKVFGCIGDCLGCIGDCVNAFGD